MGKRVIVKEPDYMPIANAAPEALVIRMRALDAASNRRGATPWGLMALRGQIDDGQSDAVDWFLEIASKFHRGIGAKSAASPAIGLASKSEPPDPFSSRGCAIAKRERSDWVEYESVRLAGLACGARVWRTFCDLVGSNPGPDRTLNYGERLAVTMCSKALRTHWARGRRNAQRVRRGA